MFGIQFYPTPSELAYKMIDGVDLKKVTTILEPSAGKGDIIDVILEKNNLERERNYNYKCSDLKVIDCCEIDENLQELLKKKAHLIGDDFLITKIFTRYDLIVMNPPFKDGEKHLLKAISLLRSNGYLSCILNAETILNPYSYERKKLKEILESKNAKIEIIEDAFKNAENKTGVTIALITFRNNEQEAGNSYILDELEKNEFKSQQFEEYEDRRLAINDIFKALVNQYEYEAELGVKLIQEFNKIKKHIPINDLGVSKYPLINLSVYYFSERLNDKLSKLPQEHQYIMSLRVIYWSKLFDRKEFRKNLTYDLLDDLKSKIYTEFINYDFNLKNIMQLNLNLSKSMTENIEKAIVNTFDKLTYENSMERNGATHYRDGWVTNKAFYVNKKVIVWLNCYENRYGWGWNLRNSKEFFGYLEKMLNFLNGNQPIERDVEKILNEIDYKGKEYNGEWIQCEFFKLSFKKKGTVHCEFTNLDLLKKFNIFAGKKKNWLPNSYGAKKYKDLTKEEKQIADEFEGEKEYNKTQTKGLAEVRTQFLLNG